MSSWKKASKVNQKVHLERHQPEKRAHLGLLEKHKDYIPRARDFQQKRNTLRKLKEHALNRNPDEYYHHMVNSRLVNDRHQDNREPLTEDTVEQTKIMKHKSLTYVRLKHIQEKKKAQKLQAQLHFVDNNTSKASDDYLLSNPRSLPDIKEIRKAQKLKEGTYKKLLKTIERSKKLAVIKEKMEIQQQIHQSKSKGESRPKLIARGTKTSAPVYEWKYERKR